MLVECTLTLILSSPSVSLFVILPQVMPFCYLRVRVVVCCRCTTCESHYYIMYFVFCDRALVCCCHIQSPPFFLFRVLTPRDMVIWETLCVNRLWFYARLSMRDTAVPRLRDTQHFNMAPYPLRKNAAFKVKQTVSARSRFVTNHSVNDILLNSWLSFIWMAQRG